ncbi:uncharacterized protein EI97DRAFT_138084 [Westerdykella ornata]|uniref:Uncharacterized protein n=1 Tax=Westerdykella ornata TaxID=318751 RepID=A0A6A6JD20_WESOR|nr:uncharacterized protein EI97DRAFT_138084 [Westerdykella ornata]KAF2273898.1 hypothetical protein EI97DRAFT_138084 [Westerdykella ornata]
MKVVIATALLAVAPLCSAWGLHLFNKPGYKDKIWYDQGHSKKGCTALSASTRDRAESMHWYSDYGDFEVVLYATTDCKTELGRSRGDWHLPGMSDKAKNNIASYKINN